MKATVREATPDDLAQFQAGTPVTVTGVYTPQGGSWETIPVDPPAHLEAGKAYIVDIDLVDEPHIVVTSPRGFATITPLARIYVRLQGFYLFFRLGLRFPAACVKINPSAFVGRD